jgi:uncharacterized protein (TIRG00374 family)
MAAHYSTPVKIGFPLTVYLLKKFEGIPIATGTAIVLIELSASMLICSLIAAFGVTFYFGNEFSFIAFIIVASVVIGAVVVNNKRPFFNRYTGFSRVTDFIIQVIDAFSTVSGKRALLYLVFSFFIRVFGSLNLYLLAIFFSEKITFLQALFSGSTAFFIGAVSLVPMGLGTRDLSMLYLLSQFGVTNETGMVIVSIQRVLFTGLGFLLGVISGSWLGIKKHGFYEDKIVSDG